MFLLLDFSHFRFGLLSCLGSSLSNDVDDLSYQPRSSIFCCCKKSIYLVFKEGSKIPIACIFKHVNTLVQIRFCQTLMREIVISSLYSFRRCVLNLCSTDLRVASSNCVSICSYTFNPISLALLTSFSASLCFPRLFRDMAFSYNVCASSGFNSRALS